MKKHTSSKNPIVVISGVQKHPIRYKLWKIFSQTSVKRASITLAVVALVFAAGTLVYANRITITDSVYAAFGIDLDKLAAELAGTSTRADGYITTEVEVTEDANADTDDAEATQLPDDVAIEFVIEPETPVDAMTPTASVSEEELQAVSAAAQINPSDNYEEEIYGGYDD